jgi:hypothetical protein
MENLKLLDLKDAHIVDGGMPYFNNYTTKKNIIGKQLFCSMNKLLKVSLPSDIELISGNVFDNCKELRTLSIPKSVKSIGDCFNLCYNLHSIHIEDLTAYCTIDFSPYNFTDFARMYIDLYLNNEKIIDLVIPEGLSVISEYAFKSVRGINSLTIPTSITSIGKSAFRCPINKYIICRNPTPPEISEVTFTNETYRATTLYVPKGSKTLFWLHPCWGKFVNIIEMDATSINNITKDKFPKNKGVYTVNGIKLSDDADNIEILPKGIYVINGKKVIIK